MKLNFILMLRKTTYRLTEVNAPIIRDRLLLDKMQENWFARFKYCEACRRMKKYKKK